MAERRREPRYGVEVAGFVRDGRDAVHEVSISNLSAQGCRFASGQRNLAAGLPVRIRCGPLGFVAGSIVWRVGEVHGLRFERTLHRAVLDHVRLFLSKQPALVEEPAGSGA